MVVSNLKFPFFLIILLLSLHSRGQETISINVEDESIINVLESIKNQTNYHFVFIAGLENKLIRDLFLRLEYRLDRDTEVFYNDRGYYDKALLTSLLYKF